MTGKNPASDLAENEGAVRETLRGVYDAWAANDADAFAASYVEDATVVLPGAYKDGKNEVRNYMAAAFDGPLKGSQGIDEPQNVRFLDDNTAVVVSEAGILMAGESELPDERRVRATWVLSRQDGKWLVSAYHNCPAN